MAVQDSVGGAMIWSVDRARSAHYIDGRISVDGRKKEVNPVIDCQSVGLRRQASATSVTTQRSAAHRNSTGQA